MRLKNFVVLVSILANVVFIFILASMASDRSKNFSEIVRIFQPKPKHNLHLKPVGE